MPVGPWYTNGTRRFVICSGCRLEFTFSVTHVFTMDLKTPITFGMIGAITVASVGHSYGLRLFSPPSVLPLALTAQSTSSIAQVTGPVTYNAVDGKRIEIPLVSNSNTEQL